MADKQIDLTLRKKLSSQWLKYKKCGYVEDDLIPFSCEKFSNNVSALGFAVFYFLTAALYCYVICFYVSNCSNSYICRLHSRSRVKQQILKLIQRMQNSPLPVEASILVISWEKQGVWRTPLGKFIKDLLIRSTCMKWWSLFHCLKQI